MHSFAGARDRLDDRAELKRWPVSTQHTEIDIVGSLP